MANLKEVKLRMVSVNSTQQITRAMKMVSAAKLRKAQARVLGMRTYYEALSGVSSRMLSSVSPSDDVSVSSLFGERAETKHALILMVSADKGLCGAFNSHVFKRTLSEMSKYASCQVLPVGRRAEDHVKKHAWDRFSAPTLSFDKLDYETVASVVRDVVRLFLQKELDNVVIVYNYFKNVVTQVLKTETWLPLSFSGAEEAGAYLYDTPRAEVLDQFVPHFLTIRLYKALLESQAAEHGARMTAMDKATENARELLKELQISYNRTRQAAITTELSEIIAGSNALSG